MTTAHRPKALAASITTQELIPKRTHGVNRSPQVFKEVKPKTINSQSLNSSATANLALTKHKTSETYSRKSPVAKTNPNEILSYSK